MPRHVLRHVIFVAQSYRSLNGHLTCRLVISLALECQATRSLTCNTRWYV